MKEVDYLRLDCLDCLAAGVKSKLAVLAIDKTDKTSLLVVVCENLESHEKPELVYSIAIPEAERHKIKCSICESEHREKK